MSLKAWESLSDEDRTIFRDAARESNRFMREPVDGARGALAPAGGSGRRSSSSTDFDRKPFEAAMAGIYAKAQRDPAVGAADRTHPPGAVSRALAAPRQDEAVERSAGLAARGRARIVGLVRAVPIRWRILSIAALNSAVVLVLAALIWNGAKVLGRPGTKCARFANPTRCWRCWRARPAGCRT